ncbi:uL13 family ribosomal protein, partial [uncultured Pelagibacterium sp.]
MEIKGDDDGDPIDVVTKAVERMISRNKLGKQQMTHLRVYVGTEHP